MRIFNWFNFRKKKKKGKNKTTDQKTNKASINLAHFFDVHTGKCYGIEAEAHAPEKASAEVLQKFSEHLNDIPSLPPVWNEVQQAIERGDSARRVTKIIAQDPGLTTEILKAANSKGLENKKEITDVNQAIVRLGFQAIRGIVIHYCTASFSNRWKTPFSIQPLWKHAMAVSTLSTITGKFIAGCDIGTASTLGLLHDIGRIGLNSICQDPFHYPPEPEVGFLAYEYEHFACTHVEAGVLLAKHWHLPTKLQQGIEFHHHPGLGDISNVPENIRKEVLAVYLADYLAIHFGFDGGNKLLVKPDPSFAPILKASLNKIAHQKAVSKELWRIQAIDFNH